MLTLTNSELSWWESEPAMVMSLFIGAGYRGSRLALSLLAESVPPALAATMSLSLMVSASLRVSCRQLAWYKAANTSSRGSFCTPPLAGSLAMSARVSKCSLQHQEEINQLQLCVFLITSGNKCSRYKLLNDKFME